MSTGLLTLKALLMIIPKYIQLASNEMLVTLCKLDVDSFQQVFCSENFQIDFIQFTQIPSTKGYECIFVIICLVCKQNSLN